MRVLITGGRGGLGRAFADALGDAEVTALDLPEFDVGDTAAWRSLEGSYDAAFLNAGVVTGEGDMAALSDEQYERAMRANIDGVVYGVRELAARLMPNGGSIVATASLAGLTATPMDPIYSLTKHAVVGFVRSCAPQLAARGIRINALCPGYTDTPIVDREFFEATCR
jgi:NAD(P)-dependent dehydrogenase (short-subunit alcohol dehydrogenase family)